MSAVVPRSLTRGGTETLPERALPATIRPIPTARRGQLRQFPSESLGLAVSDLAAVAFVFGTFQLVSLSGVVVAAIVLPTYRAIGLYRPRLSLSVLDDLPRLAGGIAIAVMGTAAVAAPGDYLVRPSSLSTLLLAGSLFAFRLVSYGLVRNRRATGLNSRRALVIGADPVGMRLAQTLQEHPEYGLRVVGFLDRGPFAADRLPAPLLGSHRDLVRTVEQYDISVVIVAFCSGSGGELVELLRGPWRVDCDIFLVPRLFEVQAFGRTDHVRGIPLTRLRRAPFTTWPWKVKRIVDVVAAALLIVLLSPVMALTVAAVRIESGGGVLFRQRRVGRNGRSFIMLKFRSIQPVDEAESSTLWTVRGDGRLGCVGRLIRRTSLDELPQLFNVLRGECPSV